MTRRKKLLPLLILPVLAMAAFFSASHRLVGAQNSGPAANGHGNLTTSNGELRTFSFNAVQKKDGTVIGNATLQNRGLDSFLKIDINCLMVTGNIATMSGVVTHSDDPRGDFKGLPAIFRVVDNGEGANSPPDLISGVVVLGDEDALITCRDPFPLPLRTIEAGNIQVKP
jgi:hypothetical protein